MWALVLSALVCLATASTAQASFGVEEKHWEAGTCVNETCSYESTEKDHAEAFSQSAGHPQFGLTTFEVKTKETLTKQREPEGAVKRVRVDVPPGLSANPNATVQCPVAEFEAKETTEGKNICETNPKYAGSRVGTNKAEVFLGGVADFPAEGAVFNLQQPAGDAQDFGIYFGESKQRIYLIGYVSWHKERVLEERGIPSGDYHEWFQIDNVPKEGEVKGVSTTLPLVRSKLIFFGRAGKGDYLTLPTECASIEMNYLEVESWEGQVSRTQTHPPIGVEGCNHDPFGPTIAVSPENSSSDQPDGATTTVEEPQKQAGPEIDTADINDAHVTLPEGLTMNPSAAHGLEGCTPEQAAIHSGDPVQPVTCPAGSQVGEVTIESNLPEPLRGHMYLGRPASGPITGPPYTVYVDASSKYNVEVRLEGQLHPDPETGRIEAVFLHSPQLTFERFIFKSKGGEDATLANPLACGSTLTQALFTPYTGLSSASPASSFLTGGCPSPLPFSLSQTTPHAPTTAGAYGPTSYTFQLVRNGGEQYLSKIRAVLPAGLAGAIPAVTLCGEPRASQGTCPLESQIGTATTSVGAGPDPYTFTGPVYMTGPYEGAPFGLSVAVPAAAGPFDLGTVVTRTAINLDPYTSRVIATTTVPKIVGGVPLRLRTVEVTLNRPNFLYNPTNCGPLATESALTSTFGALDSVSTTFQLTGCGALPFKPSFTASTSSKTSKTEGASLLVSVSQKAHEANIASVYTELPVQLPSRLTTIQKACPDATFAANPLGCPVTSQVGTATASTPLLPVKLTGPAFLVSHGGAAFPDLDIVLEGDGVRSILVGNTKITKGITSTNFAALPDVPITGFTLDLPVGPHSALAASGSLCTTTKVVHSQKRVTHRVHGRLKHLLTTTSKHAIVPLALVMPTVITAQSGAVVRQGTNIAVAGCPKQGTRAYHAKKHKKKKRGKPSHRAGKHH